MGCTNSVSQSIRDEILEIEHESMKKRYINNKNNKNNKNMHINKNRNRHSVYSNS